MAKVRLDFQPPSQPDLAKLHIYEGVTEDGPFNEIDLVAAIGAYPNYISYYTTNNAVLTTHWFAIAWETAEGIVGEMSASIQGGTGTLVNDVLNRVLLRDPSLNEAIVTQSAEYVISMAMNTVNPYDPDLTATYRQLEGLTLLTLARASIQTMIAGGNSESYTAGLVSQKSASGSTANEKQIEWLTKEANRLLGINFTVVMLMEEIDVTGLNTQTSISFDQSRLALTVNFE